MSERTQEEEERTTKQVQEMLEKIEERIDCISRDVGMLGITIVLMNKMANTEDLKSDARAIRRRFIRVMAEVQEQVKEMFEVSEPSITREVRQ